jgi:hypothetical protein
MESDEFDSHPLPVEYNLFGELFSTKKFGRFAKKDEVFFSCLVGRSAKLTKSLFLFCYSKMLPD